MATGINLTYNVNTAPIVPEKWQGQIISLIGRQYRFSTFEPLANGALEAGVFVTGSVDSLGVLNVSKPTTAGTKILGVTALNFQRFLTWDSVLNCFNYADKDIVTLVQEGDIVMYAEVAVDIGDPVFLRHTSDTGLTRIGALSKTSGTGKEAIPGAKFLEQTSAAGLVRVSLPDLI
jgi:hypothetical protein